MELKDLVGEHKLSFTPKTDLVNPLDSDSCGVMFVLDDRVYLIFEDGNDGYRSSAGPLLHFTGAPYQLGGSYHEYLHDERVLCVHETSGVYGGVNDVLSVRSLKTGQEVFRVGTENVDDYYPSFVFRWSPEGLSANADHPPEPPQKDNGQ